MVFVSTALPARRAASGVCAAGGSGDGEDYDYEDSRMTWTMRKPTESGWYWFRGPGGTRIRDIVMAPAAWGHHHPTPYDERDRQFVENIDGEWAGPLKPPL